MPADDPLRPLLDEAEENLSRRLREACEAEASGVASDSAAEIRKLEDSLLSAAMAAEQVLTVRRHMQRNTAAGPQASDAPPADSERLTSPVPQSVTAAEDAGLREPAGAGETTTIREFTDCTGKTWRAWPVTPNAARSGASNVRTLGDFQEGWICFESVDDSARRRLPRREERWAELRADELERLLDQAINVPGRKTARPAAGSEPDVRLH